MPEYFYTAKNLKGQEEKGTLLTKDIQTLSKKLQERGYFLVEASELTESQKEEKEIKLSFFDKFSKVPITEKIFFSRNLAVMISSGISFSKAILILSKQVKNKKFKYALNEISKKIIRGGTFSQSLADFKDIFPPFYSETIKIGEETGNLEGVLNNLADQMEREYTLLSDVKSAMIYPLIILSTLIGIGIFMIFFIVPKMQIAFSELNVPLPFTTKLILNGTMFAVSHWKIFLIFIIILFFIFYFLFKSQSGKKARDLFLLKLPIFSSISKETNIAVALRMLSTLLGSGVAILRSLEIISEAMGNIYYKEVFKEAIKDVQKGGKLSKAIKNYENLFYPLVSQMMEVGEESGEMPSILAKLADFYEVEVTRKTKRLSSIIEPALILIIGAAVGFFAISMLQPMFSILKGIK
ncbi:MAG: type II secretion system F family protein [Minisyncoccia bacterium]